MDTQKILASSDSQKLNTVERLIESAHQSDQLKDMASASDDRCSGGVCQVSWKPGVRPAA